MPSCPRVQSYTHTPRQVPELRPFTPQYWGIYKYFGVLFMGHKAYNSWKCVESDSVSKFGLR